MGKIICIDAGHGGKDPGAVGNGVIEKDVALKTALAVGELLKKQGFEVVYTRTSDVFVNLNERCRIANAKNADLFISVHVNSATNTDAKGTETLCYSKNEFAYIVQKGLISTLRTNDRGLKERKDLAVLNGTKMTAVLLELGFLSNADEAKMFKKESFYSNVANAVVKSVCSYFDVGVKVEEKKEDMEMVESVVMGVGGVDKEVKRILKDGENYVRLRDLEGVLKVNYDSTTKKVSVYKK